MNWLNLGSKEKQATSYIQFAGYDFRPEGLWEHLACYCLFGDRWICDTLLRLYSHDVWSNVDGQTWIQSIISHELRNVV